MAPRPNRPTLKGSSIHCGVWDGTFMRPLQGRMNRVVSESVGGAALAHGYCRSAFQAVSAPAACANSSLVTVLSCARLSFPAYMLLGGSPNVGGWLPSQVGPAIQSWTLRQAYPRAPPIQVAIPSWNLVGSAYPTKLLLRETWCVEHAPYKTISSGIRGTKEYDS